VDRTVFNRDGEKLMLTVHFQSNRGSDETAVGVLAVEFPDDKPLSIPFVISDQ